MKTPILLALISTSAWAFTFSPMTAQFEFSGPGANQSFQVENDSDQTIAVEFHIARRETDRAGNEKQTRPSELEQMFLIYPPQMSLKPKEKRSLRINYLGGAERDGAKIDRELAFRLTAEQLPLDLEKNKKSGAVIKMLLKYVASLYVTPENAKANVSVQEAHWTSEKSRSLLITLTNTGNTHQVLNQVQAAIVFEGKTIALEGKELEPFKNQNLLAGDVRDFKIPVTGSLLTRIGPLLGKPYRVDFRAKP